MLHSNSVVQTHSSRVTIQPGFLSSQVEDLKKKPFTWKMGSQVMLCLRGRKENPARFRPSTGSRQPSSKRTECRGSLFGRGLQSTEAWRYICMFSHCCINYGWNTDGVSRINAWSTHSLMLLAISKNLLHFSACPEEKVCIFVYSWGLGLGVGGLWWAEWVHH